MATKTTVDQLNEFLRDELTAIETYDQALKGRSSFSGKTELYRNKVSHEKRADILREQVRLLGGDPIDTSGLRGTVAKVIEGGAVAIGDGAALKALEQWEDHSLKDYQDHMTDLDLSARKVIEARVLPEQRETYRVLSELARGLSRPS
jgi:hypothetical protein